MNQFRDYQSMDEFLKRVRFVNPYVTEVVIDHSLYSWEHNKIVCKITIEADAMYDAGPGVPRIDGDVEPEYEVP